MRLLFSITYFHPYSSGLSLYVKRLAEALVKKNHECRVITNQHSEKLEQKENINGVEVVRAKPVIKISKGFFSIDFIIKSFNEARNCDLLIVNLPQAEGLIPAIFAKIFRKSVIVIYHCEVVLPKGILNLLIENCLILANLVSLILADKVITYTADFADHSKILPFFRKKLQTVYPPILKPNLDKRVQKNIQEKIGKKTTINIGIAARLSAEKGIEYLFEAIPLLELRIKNLEFRILIAGSLNPVGEEKYKQQIFKLVEKYKEKIIFLGQLSEDELGSFYSLLDVLVLPSVNSTEAFGMVQVEAMMMGVPVIATDLPGVRVPIQITGMGKIVRIKNSEELAEAIIEVIKNKNKYLKNKNMVEKEFAIEKTIGFYEKLISQL